MRLSQERFNEAVEQKRRESGLSRRELARRLDLSPSTFTRLAQGHRPDVDTFVKLLAWLDRPANAFFDREDDRSKTSPTDTVRRMVDSIYRDPDLSTDQARALEDIVRVAYHRFRDV